MKTLKRSQCAGLRRFVPSGCRAQIKVDHKQKNAAAAAADVAAAEKKPS